jgi:MinD-like ATPase involved in chromosome partitioning or flagellar assembly
MASRDAGSPRGPRRAASGATAVARVRVLGTGRWRPALGPRRAPRLIAVGAAARGMGTSVVASNLAVAMAGLGPSVVLVDLDLETPRLHGLFGIKHPLPGLEAWLDREIATLDAALTATGVRKLTLVTGTARTLAPARRRDLVRELQLLDGDVVIVDVGAGNRDDLFDMFSQRGLAVLVSGPERAELEATFAFLAGAAQRASARYGADAREALARFRGRLVGNDARTAEQAESFHAFSHLVREHLGIPLPALGCLRRSPLIAETGAARLPLVARQGTDLDVRAFHHMAELLMIDDAAPTDGGCNLAAEAPITVPAGPLPVDLGRYLRKHPRYPVDWAARLELDGRETDARVLDVSASGVALEVFAGLRAGDQALLRLPQLEGQPALRIVVRHVLPDLRRVGAAFLEQGEAAAQLVAVARGTRAA